MGDSIHDPGTEEPDVSLPGEYSEAEEAQGSLDSNPDEERLMRSVLENDTQSVDDGEVVVEALNRSLGNFTPDLMFENLVQDYRNASRLYGETIIRALTGYSPDYVKKNVKIPEFQKVLSQRIEENVEGLEERGVVDEKGFVTERGIKLAALITYTEELDHLVSKGLGRKVLKERDTYGEKESVVPFKKGLFRFRDVSMRSSVKTAIRRGHATVEQDDLKAYQREHKGRIQVVYAMDASGSMRGDKIGMSKRAGVALAYKAIEEGNEVGLIVFTSKIERTISPTQDFRVLLEELVKIRAGRETDLAKTILESVKLFSKEECTKHLLILSDALPTTGLEPRKETLEAVSIARDHGITISVVGITLDKDGEELARQVCELGQGRLYKVKDLKELDAIILEDYDAL
jgi:Mg-chelatase subunit ChlD